MFAFTYVFIHFPVLHFKSNIYANYNASREPSALESFSRTIRGYVPSSIPIPSVAPTPPRVSRPLSFGTLLTPSRGASSPSSRSHATDLAETTKRRGSDVSVDQRMRWREQQPAAADHDGAVFSLDEEVSEAVEPTLATRYPGTNAEEEIVWSRWDNIDAGGSASRYVPMHTLCTVADVHTCAYRRILLVVYRAGLQIWDCSSLSSVSEILNLSGSKWSNIQMAAVLPNPGETTSADPLVNQRPTVGIM